VTVALTRSVTITNKLGLHVRAATKLVNLAASFASDIRLQKNDNNQADVKSIMEVLMLAASQGTELELSVSGEDAEDAITAIGTLIDNRFDEED